MGRRRGPDATRGGERLHTQRRRVLRLWRARHLGPTATAAAGTLAARRAVLGLRLRPDRRQRRQLTITAWPLGPRKHPSSKRLPPALSNRFVDNISPVLDLGSSGRSGCGNYGTENKAPNGSYAEVEDFFTVINGNHGIQFNRSLCIHPNHTDHDVNDWAVVNDVTTATVHSARVNLK